MRRSMGSMLQTREWPFNARTKKRSKQQPGTNPIPGSGPSNNLANNLANKGACAENRTYVACVAPVPLLPHTHLCLWRALLVILTLLFAELAWFVLEVPPEFGTEDLRLQAAHSPAMAVRAARSSKSSRPSSVQSGNLCYCRPEQ